MKYFFIIIFTVFLFQQFSLAEEVTLKASIIKNAIGKDIVVYNLSNGKAHRYDCEWAEQCTKNCIYLTKEELKGRFYIPCAVCGGYVLNPINIENEDK